MLWRMASRCTLKFGNQCSQVLAEPRDDVEPAVAMAESGRHSLQSWVTLGEPCRPMLDQPLLQFLAHPRVFSSSTNIRTNKLLVIVQEWSLHAWHFPGQGFSLERNVILEAAPARRRRQGRRRQALGKVFRISPDALLHHSLIQYLVLFTVRSKGSFY
jgi:hypothetical protein